MLRPGYVSDIIPNRKLSKCLWLLTAVVALVLSAVDGTAIFRAAVLSLVLD
jgi:hypothetical protein